MASKTGADILAYGKLRNILELNALQNRSRPTGNRKNHSKIFVLIRKRKVIGTNHVT
jgi:hypothetical protein